MAQGSNVTELLSDLQRYADIGVLYPQVAADTLRKYLRANLILAPDLRVGDSDGYRQHLIHASKTHSVLALTWMPGQRTPIHDHIAWCVSGVVEGVELDESFQLWRPPHRGGKVLVPNGRVTSTAGRVSLLLPPDEDIHRVSNAGDRMAVSLHIYGADITENNNSSINRVFGESVVDDPPPGARPVSWRDGAART
jgi:predicted metal-dependent enzyme (double-stranded beta helix superfamily)